MQPFFNFITSFYLLLATVCNKKENQMATLRFYYFLASFPVVLGDFRCDVTCQACRENSLGSKPPLVTRKARTGLGTRLIISSTRAFSTNRKKNLDCSSNFRNQIFIYEQQQVTSNNKKPSILFE